MADNSKYWIDFASKNVILPPPFDRHTKTSDATTPFCLLIKSVDTIPIKYEAKSIEYQLSISLYDASYKQFFGRQWISAIMSAKKTDPGYCRLNCNQNVYFHTTIKDPSILAVIEVVAIVTNEADVTQNQSCGWGFVRVFNLLGEAKEAAKLHSLEIHSGSPRCLFFLDDDIEARLKPTSMHINISVQLHRSLLRITHLLPENVLLGPNDVLPGLVEARVDPGQPNVPADSLKKPKLLPKCPRQIDRIALTLPPNIDKFEEELCQFLHDDRRRESKAAITVIERRLHIGVHNGWCYVEKPQTVYLVGEGRDHKLSGGVSPTVRRTSVLAHRRVPSTGSNTSIGTVTALGIRNTIQISELVEDPLFAVVFTLEYIIGEQMSQDERKMSLSVRRAQSRTVTLRWAAWNPFMSAGNQEVCLSMTGGPRINPNDTFVLRIPPTERQDPQSAAVACGQLWVYWSDAKNIPSQLSVPSSISQALRGRELESTSDDTTLYDQGYTKSIPKSPRAHTQEPHIMPHVSHAAMASQGLPPPVPVIQQQGTYPPIPPAQQMFYQPYSQGQVPPGVFPPMAPVPYIYSMPPQQVPSSTSLAEIPHMPVNAPVVVATPHMTSGQSLTRAAYARLYNAGFTPLTDRHGEAPEVVHPQTHVSIDISKELRDPLRTNEIVLQLLAFSKVGATSAEQDTPKGGTVYFTFQFYRYPHVTTERLLMAKPHSDLSSDPTSVPFILQRLDSDGTVRMTSPGYEVRYFVDPSFLKPGEQSLFLQHLSQQTLHIDVWDGDSLLLIGSCSIELKYLCRQNLEAIQTTFELDVMTTEYNDDLSPPGSQPRPVGINSIVRGRLHLRLANIGHVTDDNSKLPEHTHPDIKPCVILSQAANPSTFPGGSLSTAPKTVTKRQHVARANHLVDTNREVASLLFSQKTQVTPVQEREGDSSKQRKIARMTAVRQICDEKEGKPITLLSYKQEKTERMRDLKTIDFYRQQTKRNGILSMLGQALGSEHTINPSFGSAEFFEFVLRNPFNVQQTVKIEFEDQELSVITDTREWRHFKQLYQIQTPEEEGLITVNQTTNKLEVFLRPKEIVNIPFKFQTFKADHSVKPQGPTEPFKEPRLKTQQKDTEDVHLESRVVKVYFTGEDSKPVSVLFLNVQPQPHIVNQTFRFHHPENSFLKKSVRLPQMHSMPGVPLDDNRTKLYVHCSDTNVICESRATKQSEPQDIFIKVACGSSPQIKKFYLSVFTDPFMSTPAQIWQFYVHSLQRVDVNAVEGQTSRVSLILKGTHSSRLVRCYSSHQSEMALDPADTFMLAANTVHEITVAVRPMNVGNKFFYVNIVDTEYHQLLRTWLVCVNARSPLISRGFEINLPLGGGKGSNKRISFTNPYPQRKLFSLRSNRPDLVQFKSTTFELDAGMSENLGLRFTPITQAGKADILVFINDEEDKNEETFSIKASYANV